MDVGRGMNGGLLKGRKRGALINLKTAKKYK